VNVELVLIYGLWPSALNVVCEPHAIFVQADKGFHVFSVHEGQISVENCHAADVLLSYSGKSAQQQAPRQDEAQLNAPASVRAGLTTNEPPTSEEADGGSCSGSESSHDDRLEQVIGHGCVEIIDCPEEEVVAHVESLDGAVLSEPVTLRSRHRYRILTPA
jgi:hypothetical protein